MKILKILFCLLTLFNPIKNDNYQESNISARSYILIERTTGKVIEGRNIYLTRSVASISKIMTAIIAIEDERLYDTITIGDEIDNVVGSALYIKKGTHLRIIDLVYGLLLRSGNDAAMSIAKCIGDGNVMTFVEKMNEKAHELNMDRTVFHNPHGLDIESEGNISCSYDMAVLMRYCMNNEIFRTINSAKKYYCKDIGTWSNKHRLIQKYKYAIGGKTGFTSKAKRTLITVGHKDGLELIIVTLDCGNDFALHQKILESYFEKYCYLALIEKGVNIVDDYRFFANEEYGIMLEKQRMNRLLIIYYLDCEKCLLTCRLIYADNSIEEYGPIFLLNYVHI